MTPDLRTFSLELFPPQTPEGAEKLRAARARMALLKPSFFSVTFGAGGSTRDRTLDTVLEIQSEGHAAAPHLSCIGSTRESIRSILDQYRAHGIRQLVALRGDLPSGMARPGAFRYANELVEFIRAETGDWFHIEVAAYPEYHPQAKSPREDLLAFKRKLDAGANSAITQYFYNFRCLRELRRRIPGDRHRRPDRSRHHADFQLQQSGALFRQLRRRDSALDPAPARKLR
jgi:methylenetetrahydrofolate reductase (NADPH)